MAATTMLEERLEGEVTQARGPAPEPVSATASKRWRPWVLDVDGVVWDRRRRRRVEVLVACEAPPGAQRWKVGPPGGEGLSTREALRTEVLRGELAELGLDPDLVATLTRAALACATAKTPLDGNRGHGRSEPGRPEGDAAEAAAARVAQRGRALVGAVETLSRSVAQLEGVMLGSVRELTAVTAATLLADKGVTDVEELSRSEREKFRGRAKRLTATEIGAAIGWGAGEAVDLVAVANLPVAVRAPVSRALGVGETPWRLVRRFYRETSELSTEDAATIAAALFGSDPANAVPERLTSGGEFIAQMWRHKEFYRALSREVRKLSKDPQPDRRSREQSQAAHDVRVNLDEFGTGCVMIGCTAAQGAAIANRIARAAKAARAGGDPRTLQQLRTAFGLSLLLNGTLPVEGLPDDPELITTEQAAELAKILNGLPAAQLDVIVPLNTLLGTTPEGLVPTRAAEGVALDGATPTSQIPSAFGGAGRRPRGCTCTCTCGASDPGNSPPARPGGTAPRGESCPDPAPPGEDCPDPAPPGEERPDPAPRGEDCPYPPPEHGHGVGEVIGALSVFLTPDEVRTLALTPGSTLHRLVTDPVTGTLIERSSTAYAFDGALRAHIIAADVFCRMPGCLRPASSAQIDHVQEYGTPGGRTCVTNGQPLDTAHHDLKTKKLWDAVLEANRDVTWTSLLGLIYVTKSHDYTQYTRLYQAALSDIEAAVAAGEDREAMIDRGIYQALCYRPPGAALAGEDDTPYQDERFTGWDLITLTHTATNGDRRYRPHPEAASAEAQRLLDTRDEPASPDGSDEGSDGSDDEDPTTWTFDPNSPPPF